MAEAFHISSLVVHAHLDAVPAVAAAIAGLPGAQVHGQAAGKLVVTLETANEYEIVARLDAINRLDGVLSALLVYHHAEPATTGGDASWTT